MTLAARQSFDHSPMSAALAQPRREAQADTPARAERLTTRLDAKLAELEQAGYRVCWLDIGKDQLVTLFREGGDEAIQLAPDPARDCGWYGRYEVRHTGGDLVWIMLEGEVPGEMSMHVID
jgi:hypothetical protein